MKRAHFWSCATSIATLLAMIGSLITCMILFKDINNLYDEIVNDMNKFKVMKNLFLKNLVLFLTGISQGKVANYFIKYCTLNLQHFSVQSEKYL